GATRLPAARAPPGAFGEPDGGKASPVRPGASHPSMLAHPSNRRDRRNDLALGLVRVGVAHGVIRRGDIEEPRDPVGAATLAAGLRADPAAGLDVDRGVALASGMLDERDQPARHEPPAPPP